MREVLERLGELSYSVSERDLAKAMNKLQDKFEMSHGSHNQHSSSTRY